MTNRSRASPSRQVSTAAFPEAAVVEYILATMIWLGISPVSLTAVIPSVNSLWTSIGNSVTVFMH